LPDVTFPMTYPLSQEYEETKERANRILGKYLAYPDPVVAFNDMNRSVTFFTERLIPAASTNRPHVMLLFSNPHPHSVHQGMFLSPNGKKRENPFWPVMEDAGWLAIPKDKRSPEKLADICLKASYQGPFELAFYCYYAFPTDFPTDISRVFGEEYFSEHIDPEASREFKKTIEETAWKAIVTFNKEIFNLVSKRQVERYIDELRKGELIQSQIKSIDRHIPIFLTYPTGWRYDKQYRQLRKDSLDAIGSAVLDRLKVPGRADA
jgi:hypothetical protein